MCSEGSSCVASDAVQNLIGGSGPHKRFWIFVMDVDVLANRQFQLPDAAERAAPDSFVGEFGEPSLHQIQPRTIRWREVNMKTGPLEQPFANERGLVRPIVVQDQVHIQIGGYVRLVSIEKPAEFLRTMTVLKLANHLTGFQVQRSE